MKPVYEPKSGSYRFRARLPQQYILIPKYSSAFGLNFGIKKGDSFHFLPPRYFRKLLVEITDFIEYVLQVGVNSSFFGIFLLLFSNFKYKRVKKEKRRLKRC
jgi:hypothetical protein